MESPEEVSHTEQSVENVKDVLSLDEKVVDAVVPQVCQKSNGTVETIPESSDSTEISSSGDVGIEKSNVTDSATEILTVDGKTVESANVSDPASNDIEAAAKHEQNRSQHVPSLQKPIPETIRVETSQSVGISNTVENYESVASTDEQLAKMESTVAFETEIVVEENGSILDDAMGQDEDKTADMEQDDTNNLLKDLDQNIELNEVLQSSNISGNIENNNCDKKEVFNKEELLDILEGNDEEPAVKSENTVRNQQDEVQIALQQLSRLQQEKKKKVRSSAELKAGKVVKNFIKLDREKLPQAKTNKLKNVAVSKPRKKMLSNDTSINQSNKECTANKATEKDCIVTKLVKDWDEDEAGTEEIDQGETLADSTTEITPDENQIALDQSVEVKTEADGKITADVPGNENQSQEAGRSGDDGQPQRRLGRVIKKKVIFDPDNPDTFTKGKAAAKSPQQEPQVKKNKVDTPVRPKSKSPVAKMQWKKPTPKGNKQNKRLTEVDKLLMDEGAVNMIYQLTPEAAKGKKNVRTKAEFIKKLQSSTPETSEMKFRERKKEIKEEEAKKILGGKLRTSLSGSVKSMSVCEDFETNSAEDSIIYRRHSSSSYSSSCMSPRRMSDVEGSVGVASAGLKAVSESVPANQDSTAAPEKCIEVFIAGTPVKTDMIDREDCLSIKQKLNSKLSLALNKRKRENAKTDKPAKLQKLKEPPSKSKPLDFVGFRCLNLKIEHRLAEITITHAGKKSVALLKELERALLYVDSKSEVNVTLLTSACGTLLPSLNLQPLLDNNIETRTNAAHELAESVRQLLISVRQHSKVLISCASGDGVVSGPAAALLALSDAGLAGDGAVFSLAGPDGPQPGAALFAAGLVPLQPGLVTELVLLERRLSAREAAAGGLVTRACADALGAARALALRLAADQHHTLALKKRLLRLRHAAAEAAFHAALEAERDAVVTHWTSLEGQEAIRQHHH